jgi:hypothetical protein
MARARADRPAGGVDVGLLSVGREGERDPPREDDGSGPVRFAGSAGGEIGRARLGRGLPEPRALVSCARAPTCRWSGPGFRRPLRAPHSAR